MGKLAYTAECQERTEAQRGSRMAVKKGITNQEAVFVCLEDYLLLQYHSSHTIDGSWNLVTVKLANVLVTLRAVVVALILVESQIELSTMLNNCNIERTKQYMVLVIQFWNGNH
jgi:hypothetical protein